jgi:two-component system OmpR family sensor kinase
MSQLPRQRQRQRQRPRMSIFARTFLLLASALVLMALLSTKMPASNSNLKVQSSLKMPEPQSGQVRDQAIEYMMARWMGLNPTHVRFYRSATASGLPPPFLTAPPEPPPSQQDMLPPMPSSPPTRPPETRPNQLQGMANAKHDTSTLPDFAPGAPLINGFTAAVQQEDHSWRIVTLPKLRLSHEFKFQVSLLFACGLLLMLPLAWWFSRALSAPIRRFSEAADELGRNPHAAPLERRGPSEIVQAADSFNTMQARLNRMVHERTQMIAAIAHDLRTPLTRLAFRMESLPSPLRDKTLADIKEMKEMISAALDFIQNDRHRSQRLPLDFNLLVEGVVDSLTDTGADALLDASEKTVIDGDPIALRRMVTNLAENALKYGKRARLQVRQQDAYCVLWVDDDGPGIDPSQSEQLLLPFVRGEVSRNRDTGGIGLGLAVANSIVLAHGGELQLANRDEGGLRVSVRLPCKGTL